MARILTINRDREAADTLRHGLEQLGHRVRHETEVSDDPRSAVTAVDLVLLDAEPMCPPEGLAMCRSIRRHSGIPIMIVNGCVDDAAVVAGFEAGADDYIIKPVSLEILDARIRAVVRRCRGDDTSPGPDLVQVIGDLVIDRAAHRVSKGARVLPLSPTEMRLVLELAACPGQAISRRDLLCRVWNLDFVCDSRVVDTTIQRLRHKVENNPSRPSLIETVRGYGYRLNASLQ
ncbi:response regulator transcription factor [Gordonia aurantiaca]|uniref:response regulator transcription factor n=1 Tax=Gordonia sp. B21 TaxID=3151852 RepID=UPI0032651979